MSDTTATVSKALAALDYETLSLAELAQRIVERDDRSALAEFHENRTVFRLNGGPAVTLVDFLDLLCRSDWVLGLVDGNDEALTKARDIAVDKFGRLPWRENGSTRGPDCRPYFRLFLKRVGKWREDHPGARSLAAEVSAVGILQGIVVSHLRFSCMEAKRSVNPARTRYAWRLPQGTTYVWMPRSMRGLQKRRWLERNIADPDSRRPGEQDRVQSVIDRRLGVPRHVGLSDGADWLGSRRRMDDPLQVAIQREIDTHGLTECVAEEKASNIHKQRPALQALGRSGLRDMVRRILTDLGGEGYEEKAVAEAFGLSRSTFSRFAGARWGKDGADVPDLWRNVAQTLSRHRPFVEAAREAGVWGAVEEVLAREEGAAKGEYRDE